jgi:hypothetical protein
MLPKIQSPQSDSLVVSTMEHVDRKPSILSLLVSFFIESLALYAASYNGPPCAVTRSPAESDVIEADPESPNARSSQNR